MTSKEAINFITSTFKPEPYISAFNLSLIEKENYNSDCYFVVFKCPGGKSYWLRVVSNTLFKTLREYYLGEFPRQCPNLKSKIFIRID